MKPHTILKPGIYPGTFAEFEYRTPADCKPIHKQGRYRLSFIIATPGGEEVEVRKYCNASLKPKTALTTILKGLSGIEHTGLCQHAERQGLHHLIESMAGTRCNVCVEPKTTNAGDQFNNIVMVVKI
jgi:hypothetical protein